MSAHTPGPWHVGERFERNRIWTKGREPVAVVLSFGMQPPDLDPTAQANARLIAAAPELYAVVEALLVARETTEPEILLDENCPLIDAGRAALAKARGES